MDSGTDLTNPKLANRKGDYCRYLAEFASDEKRKAAATTANEAYKVGYYLLKPEH